MPSLLLYDLASCAYDLALCREGEVVHMMRCVTQLNHPLHKLKHCEAPIPMEYQITVSNMQALWLITDTLSGSECYRQQYRWL